MAWEETGFFHVKREELCFHQGPRQVQRLAVPFCLRLSLGLRQAGTRDPLLQCLDKHLLEQQNTKKLEGTKITMCVPNWGKLWTIRYKKTKTPNCHFGRAGSKTGIALASSTQQHQSGGQTA